MAYTNINVNSTIFWLIFAILLENIDSQEYYNRKRPNIRNRPNPGRPGKLDIPGLFQSHPGQSSSKECRGCRRFFLGDDRSLCIDVYCNSDQARPNFKSSKRCDKCNKIDQPRDWKGDCRKKFCPGSESDFSIAAAGRTVLALTTDMLCAYCKHINNSRCMTTYCS